MKKRIISLLTIMTMFMSMIAVPQFAYAVGPSTDSSGWNSSLGKTGTYLTIDDETEEITATTIIGDAYSYDNDISVYYDGRANIKFSVLGMTTSNTISSKDDFQVVDWTKADASTPPYLWIAVSVDNMTKAKTSDNNQLSDLSGFQMAMLYDPEFVTTTDTNIANSFNALLTLKNAKDTNLTTQNYEISTSSIQNAYEKLEPTLSIYKYYSHPLPVSLTTSAADSYDLLNDEYDPEDVENSETTTLSIVEATLNKKGTAGIIDGTDDEDHKIMIFSFAMIKNPEGKSVLQGYPIDSSNIGFGAINANYYRYTVLDEEDNTMPSYFNLLNTELKINVTYDANGGNYGKDDDENEITQKVEQIEMGGTANTSSYTPDNAPDGKVFAGWYTDEDCTDGNEFNGKPAGDITVYAKWEDGEPDLSYTVNFLPGEGSFQDSSTSKTESVAESTENSGTYPITKADDYSDTDTPVLNPPTVAEGTAAKVFSQWILTDSTGMPIDASGTEIAYETKDGNKVYDESKYVTVKNGDDAAGLTSSTSGAINIYVKAIFSDKTWKATFFSGNEAKFGDTTDTPSEAITKDEVDVADKSKVKDTADKEEGKLIPVDEHKQFKEWVKSNASGEYVDSDGNVTTDPTKYVPLDESAVFGADAYYAAVYDDIVKVTYKPGESTFANDSEGNPVLTITEVVIKGKVTADKYTVADADKNSADTVLDIPEGKQFKQWVVMDGSNKADPEVVIANGSEITEDITVMAEFEPIQTHVIYLPGEDASFADSSASKEEALLKSDLVDPATQLEVAKADDYSAANVLTPPTGKMFKRWILTDKDGNAVDASGAAVTAGSEIPVANGYKVTPGTPKKMYVTAEYEDAYTVTYFPGKLPDTSTTAVTFKAPDAAVTSKTEKIAKEPAADAKIAKADDIQATLDIPAGYKFTKWVECDSAGVNPTTTEAKNGDVITDDKYLVATYEQIQYTVEFYGATIDATNSVAFGSETVPLTLTVSAATADDTANDITAGDAMLAYSDVANQIEAKMDAFPTGWVFGSWNDTAYDYTATTDEAIAANAGTNRIVGLASTHTDPASVNIKDWADDNYTVKLYIRPSNAGTVNVTFKSDYEDATAYKGPYAITKGAALGKTVEYTSDTLEEGASYDVPNPTKEGYVFDGWYQYDTTENKIDTTKPFVHDDIKALTADVTYVAKWQPTLTFKDTIPATVEGTLTVSETAHTDVTYVIRDTVNPIATATSGSEAYLSTDSTKAAVTAAPSDWTTSFTTTPASGSATSYTFLGWYTIKDTATDKTAATHFVGKKSSDITADNDVEEWKADTNVVSATTTVYAVYVQQPNLTFIDTIPATDDDVEITGTNKSDVVYVLPKTGSYLSDTADATALKAYDIADSTKTVKTAAPAWENSTYTSKVKATNVETNYKFYGWYYFPAGKTDAAAKAFFKANNTAKAIADQLAESSPEIALFDPDTTVISGEMNVYAVYVQETEITFKDTKMTGANPVNKTDVTYKAYAGSTLDDTDYTKAYLSTSDYATDPKTAAPDDWDNAYTASGAPYVFKGWYVITDSTLAASSESDIAAYFADLVSVTDTTDAKWTKIEEFKADTTTLTAPSVNVYAVYTQNASITFKDTKISGEGVVVNPVGASDVTYYAVPGKPLNDAATKAYLSTSDLATDPRVSTPDYDAAGTSKIASNPYDNYTAAVTAGDPAVTTNTTYKFYGWYMLDDSETASTYFTTNNTKELLDNAVKAVVDGGTGKLTLFDPAATDIDLTMTVYAVYYINDDATLKDPEEDGTKPGAAFFETALDGTVIPYTDLDGTTSLPNYPAPSGDSEIKFASNVETYYMVVTQSIEKSAARFIPSDEFAAVEAYKLIPDTSEGAAEGATVEDPVTLTKVAAAGDVPLNYTLADFALDEAEEGSMNTVYVRVTAGNGATKTYEFNILRFTTPGIHLEYGNSPVGMIMRDKWLITDPADKTAAINTFTGKKSNTMKKYGTGAKDVPAMGVDENGDPILVPVSTRTYSTDAWGKAFKENYDLNAYAYFVYQGDKFYDPGFEFVDEYGKTDTVDVTQDFELQYLLVQGLPRYTGKLATDRAKAITSAEMKANSTYWDGSKYDLANLGIRPDAYKVSYSCNYTPKDTTNTKTSYTDERYLIVLCDIGDILITKSNAAINGLDSKQLTSFHSKLKKNTDKYGNTLFSYRVADVDYSKSMVINATDARILTSDVDTYNANPRPYRFYPSIEE